MSDKLLGFVGSDAMTLLVWVVVGLIILFALLALFSRRPRRRGAHGPMGPRLAVVDQITLDDRRRLVLVRRDEVEHLIVVGGSSELLVESGIGKTQFVREHRPPVVEPAPAPYAPRTSVAAPVVTAAAPVVASGDETVSRPATQRIEPLVAAPRPVESAAPSHAAPEITGAREVAAERAAPPARSSGLLWKFGFGASSGAKGGESGTPVVPRPLRSVEPAVAPRATFSEPVRLDVPFAASPGAAAPNPSEPRPSEDQTESLKHLESEMTNLLARTPPSGQR